MGNKSQLVSKIMFYISLVMFFVFAVTVFFGGQKIAGAIYFIFFVTSVAFACLDRKYNSNFYEYYRYSVYLDDLVNILAVSSFIFYKQDSIFMIIVLCLIGVGLFVDLLSKNRLEKRRLMSIIVSILNLVLMFVIFPYFFKNNLPLVAPIILVVIACIVGALKIVLAVVPFKGKTEENDDSISDIEKDVSININSENNVE